MKILYQQIPRSSRWYYPEGEQVEDESHADLRARVVQPGEDPGDRQQDQGEGSAHAAAQQHQVNVAGEDVGDAGRRKVGRPKKLPSNLRNQPAIHRFFESVNIDVSDEN